VPRSAPGINQLRGRIGGLAVHARHDSRVLTAPARAAFLARFEQEVDPDGSLPEPERARRAALARKAYFARLALRSAVSRARRPSRRLSADDRGRSLSLHRAKASR
jgi:hypothetical protein